MLHYLFQTYDMPGQEFARRLEEAIKQASDATVPARRPTGLMQGNWETGQAPRRKKTYDPNGLLMRFRTEKAPTSSLTDDPEPHANAQVAGLPISGEDDDVSSNPEHWPDYPGEDDDWPGNPDSLYEPGSLTFAYEPDTGLMRFAPHPVTHGPVDFRASLYHDMERGQILDMGYIIGRVARDRRHISIWNDVSPSNERPLAICLHRLLLKNLCEPGAVLNAFNVTDQPIQEIIEAERAKVAETKRSKELLKQTHLLPPELKKEKLGMIGKPPSAMDLALKKLGTEIGKSEYLYPSWRATSESTEC